MRTFLLLLSLIGPLYSICAAHSADSLLKLLPQQPNKEKVSNLLQLSKTHFILGKDSLSKHYVIQSYRLARALINTRMECEARLSSVSMS
jgi:hypothetical protein